MSLKKDEMIGDFLFGVQIICTFAFGGSQFFQMLTSAKGISVSWFACWEVFLLLNLVLAVRAHRNKPSRTTLQNILSYVAWATVVALDLGVMIWKGTGIWSVFDTATIVLTTIGVVTTLAVAHQKRLPISDPVVKGYLALFFKFVPQVGLAINMLALGATDLKLLPIISGHITILGRLGQLSYAIRERPGDQSRIASRRSERANWISWIVVTIAWLAI